MARALSVREVREAGITLGPESPLRQLRSTKPRRDDEHREQVALFDWIRRHEAAIPALRWAFAVPNGGKRGMLTAKKLKAEGVRPGVLDVWMPVAQFTHYDAARDTDHVAPGLVIEMKAGSNRLTPEQKEWRWHLEAEGWRVAVCYSAAEARAALCAYLGVADPEPETITHTREAAR